MAPDDNELEPEHQLLVGLTHSVLLPNDPTEHGRVFVEPGGANPTEHWILRPTFRPPQLNGPDMIVRVRPGNDRLPELFAWGRQVAGSRYIRAACTELPIP